VNSDIVSMSLGGGGRNNVEESFMKSVYEDDGVLLIAAAGNGGNTAFSYPASYDSVMSVAAVDESENHADFSQRNSQVDIAAPGVSVLSTLPNNRYVFNRRKYQKHAAIILNDIQLTSLLLSNHVVIRLTVEHPWQHLM
jgi:subtilisin family serine protease